MILKVVSYCKNYEFFKNVIILKIEGGEKSAICIQKLQLHYKMHAKRKMYFNITSRKVEDRSFQKLFKLFKSHHNFLRYWLSKFTTFIIFLPFFKMKNGNKNAGLQNLEKLKTPFTCIHPRECLCKI